MPHLVRRSSIPSRSALALLGLLTGSCLSDATGPSEDLQTVAPVSLAAVRINGYTQTTLGTLGGSFSIANDINVAGHIVGLSETASGEIHPFVRLTATGPIVDMGLPVGYTQGSALAINDADEVTGWVRGNPAGGRAFRWTSGGGFVLLPTAGGTNAAGDDINNLGTIVGTSDNANGESHATAWFADGTVLDLGELGGGVSWALAVNDRNVVVGGGPIDQFGTIHPFRWDQSTGLVDIGTAFDGEATGITNGADEVIVGWDFVANGAAYRPGSGWTDLPKLNSRGFAIARAINDSRQIVGQSDVGSNGPTHAFVLHRPTGKPGDLSPGVDFIGLAHSINNCGSVVGSIDNTGNGSVAALWTPERSGCP
jgi:probable HAF family extracellular repeat protein